MAHRATRQRLQEFSGGNLIDFIFALIIGIGAGGLFAMLGSGIVAAFKGSGVINFAHGAIAMYTAYTWSELRVAGDLRLPWFDPLPTHWLNLPVRIGVRDGGFEEIDGFWGQAIPIALAMLMAAFIGALLHFCVFRPLRNSPALAKVIGSVGAMLWFQSIAQLNFGSVNRIHQGFLPTESFDNFLGLDGKSIGQDRIVVFVAALIMCAIVWGIYTFTSFGLATRAADENEKGATLLGYSPQRLALANWVLSALMAGAAGLLFVGILTLNPVNYTLLIVPALAAALIGNLQSIPIATAGGLGLGIVQSGMVNLANKEWWPEGVPASAVRETIPLVVVVLFLYLRGDKLPVRGAVSVKGQPFAPQTRHPFIASAMPIFAVLVVIVIFTREWEVALTSSLTIIPVMLSLVVLIGYLGQISLAQSALAGVAAFMLVRFTSDGTKTSDLQFIVVDGLGLPHPVAIILAVCVAVLVGMLIGLPALRIRGVQLAVVTITAVVAIRELIFKNETISGPGAKSNSPVPRPSIFGFDVGVQDESDYIPDNWQFAVFSLIIVVLLCFAVVNLRRGGTGRRFLAIRANERAAAAAGVDVARSKMLGFAISAALAGFGGVLVAYKLTSISFENYDVFIGLAVLAFAYLGGISMVSGSVFGGMLAAGGLTTHFISHHFDDITKDYITAVGALGLILNAVITNGEGIAMLSKHSNDMMINFVRHARSEHWRRLALRLAPTVAVSLLAGWFLWASKDGYRPVWMLLLAVYIGLNIRALVLGIKRVITKTGGMIYVPPPDSPAWGPEKEIDLTESAPAMVAGGV